MDAQRPRAGEGKCEGPLTLPGEGGLSDHDADGRNEPWAGLAVAALLSSFAGAVDACGLSILKDLFVSFMSGNTTSLGVALGRWDIPRIALISEIIGAFVIGAAAGTILATLVGRHHLAAVVLAVAVALCVPLAMPAWTIVVTTFAMGALNAAMDHAGAVSVSITYVTGTLVKLGRGLGLLLCGRSRDLAWVQQAVSWVGILCGATLAELSLIRFGHATFVALPLAALTVSALAYVLTRNRWISAA